MDGENGTRKIAEWRNLHDKTTWFERKPSRSRIVMDERQFWKIIAAAYVANQDAWLDSICSGLRT
jgi:hypothetical protein